MANSTATSKHVSSECSAYEDDFEKSLLSSTPRISAASSVRVRKVATIIDDESDVSTIAADRHSIARNDEWEKWILKKAEEMSFNEEEKRKIRKEEKRKLKEIEKEKKRKQKQNEAAVKEWERKKLIRLKEQQLVESKKVQEAKAKKEAEKQEVLEKSAIAVQNWEQKKIEKEKVSREKERKEKEKQDEIEKDRRAKAEAKYLEWIKTHKSQASPKSPKTLTDMYNPHEIKKSNLEEWNSDTNVKYKDMRNLYSPF